MIETFTDRRVERYWQLLAIMNGWPQRGPSATPAWEWLLAALRTDRRRGRRERGVGRRGRARLAVQRDAGDDEREPRGLGGRRDLREHHDPDDRRGGRQQGDEQRVRRASQAGERELIADVGDDRRGDADADAGQQRDRIAGDADRLPAAQRGDDDGGDQHRGREPVDAAERVALGDAVGEHDVQREQPGVGEREREAERLRGELHVGEQVDARHRERQGGEVARRACAERRERDDRQELDRGDRAEREPVDRRVEADVHQRQDRAPGEQQPAPVAILRGVRAPRPAPQREDQRRGRDPQPRHAEHVDAREEQHGERGAEVVEDRADEEVQMGGGGRFML